MRPQNEILERAFQAIDELVGRTIKAQQEPTATAAPREGSPQRRVFPHCPRCASYALYRRNNVGNYACLTCELRDISEETARRLQ